MLLRRTALWSIAVVVASRAAAGQELRGTVRDSASRQGVPGAVIMLLDSAGQVLGRNITNERGEYRVALNGAMHRARFVRIGYRPRDVAIPVSPPPSDQIDVTMSPIPAFLEPVRVTVNPNCPRRSDRDAAFALYEQARAGLLATVVAREANPAALIRLRYDRVRDGPSLDDRIVHQQVRMDSAGHVTTSFEAALGARDFVRRGFVQVSGDSGAFFGPDADALLDDAFSAGYCFHIADHDRARPNEVGLAFAPADRRTGRIDIDGVLWVDTVARALRDIDYRYVGLDARTTRAVHPGGTISFAEMPNGAVLIDRWSIRMPQVVSDSLGPRRGSFVPYTITVREVGGEIARADWPDGTAWVEPLGELWLRVLDREGRPARHVSVRLSDTDYRGVPDSQGNLQLSHLVPGPYSVSVVDSTLAAVGVVFGAPNRLVARRDSVIRAVVTAPSIDEFTAETCGGGGTARPPDAPNPSDTTEAATAARAWLLGLVVADGGTPVTDANWELRRQSGASWVVLASGRGTARKGVEQYCWPATIGDSLEVRVWRDPRSAVAASYGVSRRSGVLRLQLPRDR